jgi:hypothetical protein
MHGTTNLKSGAAEAEQSTVLLKRILFRCSAWLEALNTRDVGPGEGGVEIQSNGSLSHCVTFSPLVAICKVFRL